MTAKHIKQIWKLIEQEDFLAGWLGKETDALGYTTDRDISFIEYLPNTGLDSWVNLALLVLAAEGEL